jgi:hypothetical protein
MMNILSGGEGKNHNEESKKSTSRDGTRGELLKNDYFG